MNIRIAESFGKCGQIEFYFVGLEDYDDFEHVSDAMISEGYQLDDKLDGIYSRLGYFRNNTHHIKLVYHEDVGTFLCSANSNTNNETVRQLVHHLLYRLSIG